MNNPTNADSYTSSAEAVATLYNPVPVRKDGIPFPQLTDRATATHDGMRFQVNQVGGVGSVVSFAPENLQKVKGYLVQCSGYMQAPTSMLTDKILKPLLPIMEERGIVGIAYTHGGRGSPDPLTNQGRWSSADLQAHIAGQIRSLLAILQQEFSQHNGEMSVPPVFLMGHSQGAQTVAHMLTRPEKYGFHEGQIRGATLINTVPLPYSQAMLLTGGLVTNIVRRGLPGVVKSLLSGNGFLLRGDGAFNTFLSEGDMCDSSVQRLVSGTYPAEGAWFVQALTTGTSPKLDPSKVRGMPISLVTSADDQLMGEYTQKMTHDHVVRSAADVLWQVVPGRHFSPIVTLENEPPERVREIVDANSAAFEHVLQAV